MVTTLPFFTPCFFRTLARRQVAASNWAKVMVCSLLPSSLCQMIAVLLPRPAATCRSRQLTETLSCPPSKNFTYGVGDLPREEKSCHKTVRHFFIQVKLAVACWSQNCSVCSIDW